MLAITKSRDDVNGPEKIFISLHTDNAVLHSEKSLQIKEYSPSQQSLDVNSFYVHLLQFRE